MGKYFVKYEPKIADMALKIQENGLSKVEIIVFVELSSLYRRSN